LISFPADDRADTVSIALIGDVLEMSHPEMQSPMMLHPAQEQAWELHNDNPDIPPPTTTLEDVELIANCVQMDLPRIAGTATATVDGTEMVFVNRLVFFRDNTLLKLQPAEA
jgi:hypothetical protein